MIRIESITIKEFRGIRDFTLDLGGKSFAVCGPNGTGKSGVVDALEFALTGNVSRLSGEGRGDVSLREHGPHVDSRNAPANARVVLTVSIPSLRRTATLERTVQAPNAPKITPRDPTIIAALQRVQAHPEIVLSRREIIRYVLATPGKRNEEIQALLHLDVVEKVRARLQKIANSAKRQSQASASSVTEARGNLLRALGITEISREKILSAANTQRALLGLPPLTEITETFSFKDGFAAQAPTQAQRLSKTQTLEDIKNLRAMLDNVSSPGTTARVAEAKSALQALSRDPLVTAGITRENFYRTGIELIEAEACPLCDTTWDPVRLRGLLQEKLTRLREAARKRKAAEALLAPLIDLMTKLRRALTQISESASRVRPPVVVEAVTSHDAICAQITTALSDFLPLAATVAALESLTNVPQALLDQLSRFEAAVKALPEPTKQDAAREWLTIAQERWEVFREARRKQKAATEQTETSRKVSALYAATSDEVLAGMYRDVEREFAQFYAFVNRGDENEFQAKLLPSLGKLGFDVDFYGRGFFPPGAYHSEGHQDGMGLCLYLALMRHLQGPQFTLAVLDDVLMSVDASHRLRDSPKSRQFSG